MKFEKIITFSRDIICLPMRYGCSNSIKIPRDRNELSRNGLIGKINISSDMNQEEIFSKIRSIFRKPMGGSTTFCFDVLQLTGGKQLTVPALSPNYVWTASSIVPKNSKSPLYILAKEPLIKVL